MDELTGGWRRIHKGETSDGYSSPDIVWVTQYRRIKWMGNVAHVWRREMNTRFWWGNPGKRHL